jgi:hypothetical protein
MLGNILLFLFVTIFTIVILYVPFFFGMVGDVQENWNEYRCSPTVLPISGYLNKEEHLTASEATQQNFEYCTGAISGNFMEEILEPIHFISNGLTNLGGDMVDNFASFRQFLDNLRNSIIDIINKIIGCFSNIIVEVIKQVLDLNDITGKLQSIIMSSAYTLQTTSYALGSAWNGPTGDFIRKVAKVV